MINVVCTEQEKKDLAVIYGFLAEVWAARQSMTAGNSGFVQAGRKTAIEQADRGSAG